MSGTIPPSAYLSKVFVSSKCLSPREQILAESIKILDFLVLKLDIKLVSL